MEARELKLVELVRVFPTLPKHSGAQQTAVMPLKSENSPKDEHKVKSR